MRRHVALAALAALAAAASAAVITFDTPDGRPVPLPPASDSAPAQTREAYVTALLNNHSGFILAAETLALSLRRTGTTRDLVCMITPVVSTEFRLRLLLAGYRLVVVPPLVEAFDECRFKMVKESMTLKTKIQVWTLVEYDKIIFLDCDAFVQRNIDHLFERPGEPFTCSPVINTGVMVLTPSMATFQELLHLTYKIPGYSCDDQGVIMHYMHVYRNWTHQSREHSLERTYNFISDRHWVSQYPSWEAWVQAISDAHVLHWAYEKPWLGQSPEVRPFMDRWSDLNKDTYQLSKARWNELDADARLFADLPEPDRQLLSLSHAKRCPIYALDLAQLARQTAFAQFTNAQVYSACLQRLTIAHAGYSFGWFLLAEAAADTHNDALARLYVERGHLARFRSTVGSLPGSLLDRTIAIASQAGLANVAVELARFSVEGNLATDARRDVLIALCTTYPAACAQASSDESPVPSAA